MERLLIIDGNNLLFQMFYGMPSAVYNEKGWPIHGTIGFISFVIKEIKYLEATKVIVVFDSDGAEERMEIYPEYKGNRVDDWDEMSFTETPFSQEEHIKKALDYMDIKYIYSEGTEADDYISSLALMGREKGEVFISSFDSDFFQLIDDRVSVLRYRGKSSVLWDREKFIKEYGFSPSNFVLYKSIVGDAADNIKGIEGMGRKRTSSFIQEYEERGSFFDSSLSLRLKGKLRDGREIIERNMKIIRFMDVDPKVGYEELGFDGNRVEEGNSKVLEKAGVFNE